MVIGKRKLCNFNISLEVFTLSLDGIWFFVIFIFKKKIIIRYSIVLLCVNYYVKFSKSFREV